MYAQPGCAGQRGYWSVTTVQHGRVACRCLADRQWSERGMGMGMGKWRGEGAENHRVQIPIRDEYVTSCVQYCCSSILSCGRSVRILLLL